MTALAQDSRAGGDAAAQRLIVVTGLSGAGKSSALRALEDAGYEAVDNLPLSLLDALTHRTAGRTSPLAIGIDSRTRDFDAAGLVALMDRLEAEIGIDARLVFLDCTDEELSRRFSQTRRRHPLAQDRPVADGIAAERAMLQGLIDRADLVVDTTGMSAASLKQLIVGQFSPPGHTRLSVAVISFAYRYGLPREADLVFDVRFLQNPFYDAALRERTGREPDVAAFIERDDGFAAFFGGLTGMLAALLARYEGEGKSYLTIAIGCTGGRHRSVFVAERLARWLEGQGRMVLLSHRDVARSAAG
jgi:UPF0042 nucleotide-binding protein